MTTLREAAQAALDALTELHKVHTGPKLNDEGPSFRASMGAASAMGLLRAALARPEPTKRDPWDFPYNPKEQPEPAAEPVAWLAQKRDTNVFEVADPNEKATNPRYWTDAFPLYAAPQPQRGPLSEEEIDKTIRAELGSWLEDSDDLILLREVARAVERAHGIE